MRSERQGTGTGEPSAEEMQASAATASREPRRVHDVIVEIVSDSGEGAQKAGQTFGALGARMGNGVWTVEIIPAEIMPPARSRAGASGIRIRMGSKSITNMGDEADLVVAFNEQVIHGRVEQGAYKPGTIILLENKWAEDPQEEIRARYAEALREFAALGFDVRELPMEKLCLEITPNPRRGKNMFVLGMLCAIFNRDLEKALQEVSLVFATKSAAVIESNHRLVIAGVEYARANLDLSYEIPTAAEKGDWVVMNGNQAVGLGIMASGMELVAMYPITPASSVSHFLAEAFSSVGGFVHQAEDEIAAMGFALGASYAGKTACTITSGPGLALKMEFLGLAVMAEIPLVLVLVQRGGPSTGLPTKVEQGDLLSVLFGTPGDAPKVVLAPATIGECFDFVITARKLAEEFRTPVVLLTDANLATGVQPLRRPRVKPEWMAPPPDQTPWDETVSAYDWDEESGLSPRPIPGQRGGEYILTGLAHTKDSKVSYDPVSNQRGCDMRSRKLSALQKSLKPPVIHGPPEGELLVVSWGSTLGSVQEGVDRVTADGHRVSSIHLRFLSPLEPGLKEIFSRFDHVMTVEKNYSDKPDAPLITGESRRYAQLAWLLRAHTGVEVDCWSCVSGQPLPPSTVHREILHRLDALARMNGRS